MRAYELSQDGMFPKPPKVTLKHIHHLKCAQKRRLAAKRKRDALLPLMYAREDYHQKQLDLLDREKAALAVEKERLDVQKKKVELASLQNRDPETVSVLARRERQRRKKCRN